MNLDDGIIVNKLQNYFTEEYLKSYDYYEVNIGKFKKAVLMSTVADPLDYLLNVRQKVGVSYEKYLFVKAMESKLRGNRRNFEKVQTYWNVWARE